MDGIIERLEKAGEKYGISDVEFLVNSALFQHDKYNEYYIEKEWRKGDILEKWGNEYQNASILKNELEALRKQTEIEKKNEYEASKNALQECRTQAEIEKKDDYQASKRALQEEQEASKKALQELRIEAEIEKKEEYQASKKALQGYEEKLLKERQEHSAQQKLFIEQLVERDSRFDKMLENERTDKKSIIDSMHMEIDKRSDENNKNLLEKIIILEERLEQKRKDVEDKDQRIDTLEKKYKLSATKGGEYEKDIYNTLSDTNEKEFDSIWIITRVGHRQGHKGDIIVEHKITGTRIMLDPKNDDIVEKKDNDKFLNDMRNPLNNFHAGIMLSRGKIRKKRSYEAVDDGTKKLVYMSYYKVSDVCSLMTEIEKVHNEIQKNSSTEINMKALRKKYLKDYDYLHKQRNNISMQEKLVDAQIKEITSEYSDRFDSDIATDSMKKSDSTLDNSDLIYKFLDDNIVKDARSNVSVKDVHNAICTKIPNIKSKRMTQCINRWKKQKFNDNKNVTAKSVMKGYSISDGQNNQVFIVTTD